MIEPLVDYIQSHPQVTVFMFTERFNTINLLADDIILMLTNLSTLRPQAHKLLTELSLLSYYIVNFNKSLILNLGIP